jgi:uncharacterized membrane protein
MKRIARVVLGVAFIVAGLNHFWQPRFYRAIMPPYIPEHELMVALSGYAEVILGALVFVPRLHQITRAGLVALLIAIFPANLHMALNPERYSQVPEWLLWARLPLQAVMVAWVLWAVESPMREEP